MKGLRKQGKPNITFNIPEAPAPLVNVMIPKPSGSIQTIERDAHKNISTTRTEIRYDGYVLSSGDSLPAAPSQAASVQEAADGTIVINAPTPKRQVVNIKMPKVTAEEMQVVRDRHGDIEYTVKKVRYEE